ncbi:MAG: hypothetical protein E7198_01975 [Schwartzia succinivorans]|jgi:hypothetical protein|uniref:hypothetical protein n=1 Tax=Schwartzia succinivorans TaxID=55507 RepID=UPI002354D078|nr:hypothetical protein [Schwartzia succinivorans]MBE6096552.1 hypothetical protein [Schwartzia succinivorans]
MNEAALENVYNENLEERIISCLAEKKNLTLDEAMDVYYQSRLAKKIQQGVEGIQYLDYQVLVEILCDTEKELFNK